MNRKKLKRMESRIAYSHMRLAEIQWRSIFPDCSEEDIEGVQLDAYEEFRDWLDNRLADAWDEGYRAKEYDQSRYVYGPAFEPARNPYIRQAG